MTEEIVETIVKAPHRMVTKVTRKILPESRRVIIITEWYDGTTFTGIARCNITDHFDIQIGTEIALSRSLRKGCQLSCKIMKPLSE